MHEHPISLRLKLWPDLVAKLDQLRKCRGISMTEAVNLSLAIALEAQGQPDERTSR